jgi:tRNA threonylcarbamoyladenosine biosynthesis protein TsaE
VSLVPGVTVLLSGDLGAGKTVFVQGVGDALGRVRVRSPSFTLINEYPTDRFTLVHADFYRLEREGADELGLEDYLNEECVLFVEWPERWRTPPEDDVLKIRIEILGKRDRSFSVSSLGKRADAVLRDWLETLQQGVQKQESEKISSS